MVTVPGFRALEDKLLIYSSPHGEVPPEVEQATRELSLKTFGIAKEDVKFEIPEEHWGCDDFSPERARIEKRYEEYERRFETTGLCEEDAAAVLSRLGLDFYDERGFPLRCIRLFCRQAEAAAKGLKGRMPDRASVDLEQWGNSIERDARAFMAKKKLG